MGVKILQAELGSLDEESFLRLRLLSYRGEAA